MKKKSFNVIWIALFALVASILIWILYLNKSVLHVSTLEDITGNMERVGGTEGDMSHLNNYEVTPQKLNEYYSSGKEGETYQVEKLNKDGTMEMRTIKGK